jgi:hypothetical protein
MAGLEGTINTPFGTVQKKTALYIGGGLVVVGAIVYYRQKQAGDVPTDDGTDNPINPATGYPYGSAEDAAALAEQAGYISPTANDPTTGGGSSIPSTGTGYVSNGAWVQGVISYMTSNGLVEDATLLSAALGKYITGSYVVPGSNDDSLITQAIAAQGYPPISGVNGMPPAINRNPPQTTTPPVTTPPNPSAHPRGYGWYHVVAKDNINTVVKKYPPLTLVEFIQYNGADALRAGEWVKVRKDANPTVGYNGVK